MEEKHNQGHKQSRSEQPEMLTENAMDGPMQASSEGYLEEKLLALHRKKGWVVPQTEDDVAEAEAELIRMEAAGQKEATSVPLRPELSYRLV